MSGRQGSLDLLINTAPVFAAVTATGSITVVTGAELVDEETFTLDDGVNPPTVFEFDDDAAVTPGNVTVAFTGGDTATQVRDAVIAAIVGVGAGLAITPSIGGAAVVTLTNDAAGTAGNQTITEDVVDASFVVTGMSGGVDDPARTVCYLTDSLTTPTKYIAVRVDSSDRPYVEITDHLGTVVAAVTPSYPALPAGRHVRVQLSWDSQNAVDPLTGRRATLRINGEAVPGANWSTSPTSNWTFFQPTHLVVGAALGDADFNGTVLSLQLSNVVAT